MNKHVRIETNGSSRTLKLLDYTITRDGSGLRLVRDVKDVDCIVSTETITAAYPFPKEGVAGFFAKLVDEIVRHAPDLFLAGEQEAAPPVESLRQGTSLVTVSGNGTYEIRIGYQNMPAMFAAHDDLIRLLGQRKGDQSFAILPEKEEASFPQHRKVRVFCGCVEKDVEEGNPYCQQCGELIYTPTDKAAPQNKIRLAPYAVRIDNRHAIYGRGEILASASSALGPGWALCEDAETAAVLSCALGEQPTPPKSRQEEQFEILQGMMQHVHDELARINAEMPNTLVPGVNMSFPAITGIEKVGDVFIATGGNVQIDVPSVSVKGEFKVSDREAFEKYVREKLPEIFLRMQAQDAQRESREETVEFEKSTVVLMVHALEAVARRAETVLSATDIQPGELIATLKRAAFTMNSVRASLTNDPQPIMTAD